MQQDSQLNPRQAEFVRRYLESGNGTKAYMEVYQETSEETAAANASRLLRNDKVQTLISDHRKQLDQTALITTEQILLRTANLAATAPRVSDRLRALDMLAKMRGMYTQKLQVESSPGIVVNVYPAPLPTEQDDTEHHHS